jgi:AcrR family transcriptional regulator
MNRKLQKQATRQKLLDCAQMLFSEQGYKHVSTRQIALSADVSIGTLFSHFKDKHSLTKELFYTRLHVLLVNNQVSEDKGALVFFEQQTLLLYQFYATDRDMTQAFLKNAMFEIDFFSEQLHDFISKLAELLIVELPDKNEIDRMLIAKAWFGFYFFELIQGISNEESHYQHWHQCLIAKCKGLLKLVTD